MLVLENKVVHVSLLLISGHCDLANPSGLKPPLTMHEVARSSFTSSQVLAYLPQVSLPHLGSEPCFHPSGVPKTYGLAPTRLVFLAIFFFIAKEIHSECNYKINHLEMEAFMGNLLSHFLPAVIGPHCLHSSVQILTPGPVLSLFTFCPYLHTPLRTLCNLSGDSSPRHTSASCLVPFFRSRPLWNVLPSLLQQAHPFQRLFMVLSVHKASSCLLLCSGGPGSLCYQYAEHGSFQCVESRFPTGVQILWPLWVFLLECLYQMFHET